LKLDELLDGASSMRM